MAIRGTWAWVWAWAGWDHLCKRPVHHPCPVTGGARSVATSTLQEGQVATSVVLQKKATAKMLGLGTYKLICGGHIPYLGPKVLRVQNRRR